MKYYLYSAGLILIAVTLVATLPFAINQTEKHLTSLEVPQNNSAVAGIQKYNIPPISKNIPLSPLSAKAALVKDLTTQTILYQKDINVSLPIASTTKIMTALVASEYFKANSILRVKMAATIGGSKVGLISGEDLSFRSLLYGMLLNSGNDAAYALAENYPGGVPGFVTAMNNKAAALNLHPPKKQIIA